MSSNYTFRDQDKLRFVFFVPVYRIDVSTRNIYKDMVADSFEREGKRHASYEW